MIHKQPFTLPLHCRIDDLPSVASVIQTNYLLQGVILQLDNATPHNTYEHNHFTGRFGTTQPNVLAV